MAHEGRLLLTGGMIWGHPQADTVAIVGDRILGVGDATEFASWDEAERIELQGAVVLPGFIDAHVHLFHTGLEASGWIVCLGGLTREGCLECLREATRSRDMGTWVYASGWDESGWDNPERLDREALDRVSPRHPMIAARVDGHLAVVNSLGLAALREHLPETLVDHRLGHLREEAVIVANRLVEAGPEEQAAAVAAAARHLHAEGITSVHTMTSPRRFATLRVGCRAAGLRTAAFASTSGAVPDADVLFPRNDEWFRVVGWKTFADGSIGARNAAVSQAYLDGGMGELNLSDDALRAWMTEADAGGWSTAVHAIGDRAIEQVLSLYESQGANEHGVRRIEHFEFPTARQIDRVGAANVALCMQPNFVGNWSGPGRLYDVAVGGDRDARCNPYRTLVDAGVRLAFGSDGMPVSARYGLHAAVHGPHTVQRLGVEEAVAAYTEWGAGLVGEGEEKGRIAPGFLADLVVLDDDPRRAERLDTLRILSTFVGGRRVFVEGTCA